MERSITIPAKLNIIQTTGYVMLDCDKPIFDSLKSICHHMIDTNFENCISYNKRFLSNLPSSYQITDEKIIHNIENFLNDAMPSYWNSWGEDFKKYQPVKITEKDVWAVFQKSGEHVSLHNHNKRFSFVIWLQIPYNNDEEKPLLSDMNEPPGTFMFVVPSFFTRGGIQKHNIPLNKSCEGKMIIWPSYLNHQVTPFYSDENVHRISVSGNFEFVTDSYS